MSERENSPYETGLDKNRANYVPLSPIGFLRRSAAVYPQRSAVIRGNRRYSWREASNAAAGLPAAYTTTETGPSSKTKANQR